MDQVHVVRHKGLVEGRPIRQVARELGISRNTVPILKRNCAYASVYRRSDSSSVLRALGDVRLQGQPAIFST